MKLTGRIIIKRVLTKALLARMGVRFEDVQAFEARHEIYYPDEVGTDYFFTAAVRAFIEATGRSFQDFIKIRNNTRETRLVQAKNEDVALDWDFFEGAEISGTVESFHNWESRGRIHEQVRIRDDAGALYAVYLAAVLKSIFRNREINVGDELLIRCLGQKPGRGGGRAYWHFEVVLVEDEVLVAPDFAVEWAQGAAVQE